MFKYTKVKKWKIDTYYLINNFKNIQVGTSGTTTEKT